MAAETSHLKFQTDKTKGKVSQKSDIHLNIENNYFQQQDIISNFSEEN